MPFLTVEKIARLLPEVRAAIHREIHPVPRFKFHDGECSGAERPEFDDRGWPDFEIGGEWGGYDRIAWFRARVPVPDHLRERKLALRFLVGPRDGGGSTAETMLYANGSALQAIDVWHEEAWLPPEHARNQAVTIALRAWSGVLDVPERRRFKLAQLIWIDEAAEDFFYLADTLLKAVRVLGENDLRRVDLLRALDGAVRQIDFARPQSEAFYCSVRAALDQLRETLAGWEAIPEIKPKVIVLGHAHIDMAWLWRLAHSRDKAGRTFATVLHLMRQYPEYRFVHSSPLLYRFLKQDYPEIFARVKERIASGAWEITGGTWIEPDTNLPSGEALIRQFLFGRRYVRSEFGVEMNVLFLPDVFGYSAALPQIIQKCGLKYFLTTKISWSQFNRFPYDTFRWRGLDGTEVLTHFVTTPDENAWFCTYNGQLWPADVKGLWDAYRQKDVNTELLMLFGWGDGGGGPTKEMLESARALKNLPGLPSVEPGMVEPYFARLDQRLADKDLPVWDGELYLEYHRGTYTSQAATKRANRQAEILYHDAEWLCALADIVAETQSYPAELLNTGWELILLNQFHDILPGSSIHPVYEDSARDYAQVQELGRQAVAQAQSALLDQIGVAQESVVVFNSLSWSRGGLIALPWSETWEDHTLAGDDGAALPAQVVEADDGRRVLFAVPDVPSLGYRAYPVVPVPRRAEGQGDEAITITPTHLENRFYRIELNAHGQIAALLDKRHERPVLAPGQRGNVLQTFQDKPLAFDAWDIDIFYQEKMAEIDELIEAAVEESGPLRGVLRLRWRFRDSVITQRLTLYRDWPRIDFRTEVEWREAQTLLKVAFPANVRATRATYDIQFGSLERPTHWNTSWDWARFEVCGHKWVDLSEGDYGVALLNDCKYGHDVKDNVMRLTLIKSPIRPDALADKGRHAFTYSLWPHAGDWRQGGVPHEAYALNYPLRAHALPAQPGGRLPARYALATVEDDRVVVETVKKAEDERAWIVRVYENQQCRCQTVTLTFGQPIRRAVECNLVEEGEAPVAHAGAQLTFAIRPFEIKTFKIWF